MSTEREIHEALIAYLRKNRLSYIHARMDKKSGIREGWPDVTVIHCGRAHLIELKTRTGKLSEVQTEVIAELRRNGTGVTVARSCAEAVAAVESWLGLTERPTEAPAKPDRAPEPPALFLGKIGVTDYVFRGDGTPGSEAKLLRVANAQDLLALRTRGD